MPRSYHSFPEPSGTAAGRNHPDDSGRSDSAHKVAPLYKPPGNQNEPDCATLARFARRLVDDDGKAYSIAVMTQAEYDALGSYSATTIYCITE